MAKKSYTFHIRKSDHFVAGRRPDLHVHVYFNEGKSRKLIGRYRLPTLEPVFGNTPELNNSEMQVLRDWLAQPEQQRKLQDALESTLFDMDKVAALSARFAEIKEEDGDTYLNIRIPVTKRLQ